MERQCRRSTSRFPTMHWNSIASVHGSELIPTVIDYCRQDSFPSSFPWQTTKDEMALPASLISPVLPSSIPGLLKSCLSSAT